MNQLGERVIHIPDTGAEDGVALANPLVERHLFHLHHHAFAHLTSQQVIEVLNRARPCARVAALERVAHRCHVTRRRHQAQQLKGAAERARVPFGQRARQQGVGVQPARHKQVVVQRERVKRACGFLAHMTRHAFRIDRHPWVRPSDPLQCRHGFGPQELIRVVKRRLECGH